MPKKTEIHIKSLEYIPRGKKATDYQAGDFILTRGKGFFAELIRFGQLLRFTGADYKFAYWNHAALITTNTGEIIEALTKGVYRRDLSYYDNKEYILVRIEASDEDRLQAVSYAEGAIGNRYGWLTISSICLSLITGLKFSFGFDESRICSGLVAGALERTNAIFPRPASHIMPGDLAKYYDVRQPDYYIAESQKLAVN